MYDIIGDIHGYAKELEQLLEKLGYEKEEKGYYSHSKEKRQVIFLGDFIDRGPEIRQVLEIVRPMIDSGEAMAVMGNHEFNALAYHTEDPGQPDEHLRTHSEKNTGQHQDTLDQLGDKIDESVEWFRSLPLWLELEDENGKPLRVAHACWDDEQIRIISDGLEEYDGVTTGFLTEASRKGSPLYDAVECVLKGPELPLPDGTPPILDRENHERYEIRIQWYREPEYEEETYSQYALPPLDSDSDKITRQDKVSCHPYPEDAPPVFIGHYWLRGEPKVLTHSLFPPNIACVDYSIADDKAEKEDRRLCAYSWKGEQRLKPENFTCVPLLQR